MRNKRNIPRKRYGLQGVTLCISTAMVLVLLGLVVLTVFTAHNLSSYVKENLQVTMILEEDMSNTEAMQICKRLQTRPYVNHLEHITKEEALKEGTKEMGTDPSEFIGANPFLASIELTLKAEYANNDSLRWISKELKGYSKVSEIKYDKDLIEKVNHTLAKISVVLLAIAVLLTFVSFSLINNTVRLGIFASRFSIHTMKLVGASWNFIRRPFVRKVVLFGIVAAAIACLVLAGIVYALYFYNPDVMMVLTWQVLVVTAIAVFFFGIIITAICAHVSVNKYLRMRASELYKI